MSYAIKTKFLILIFLLCTGELLKVTGSPSSADVGVLNHNVQPSGETALSSKRRSARSFYAKWKRSFGIHEATGSELEEVAKRSFCSSKSDIGKTSWLKDCSRLRTCVAKKTVKKTPGCMQDKYRHPKNCVLAGTEGFPCIINGVSHISCRCVKNKKVGRLEPSGCGNVGRRYDASCNLVECLPNGKSQIIERGCQDAASNCMKVGETGFPCILGGIRHERCECQPHGVAVPREEGCGVHRIGEEYFVNCQLLRCVGPQKHELVANACQDENKICRLVGDLGFPCTVDGRQHQQCRCDEDPSSSTGVIIVPIQEGSSGGK